MDDLKRQGKALVSSVSRQMRETYGGRPDKVSADAGTYMFHYIVSEGVVYLTMAEKSYPKALAFEYLEELRSEFTRLYGPEVDGVSRPYAFVKFDTFIQRTRKLYVDHRTHRNLQKLQGTLHEVHQVMTQNIQEILGQGSRLDRMTEMSSHLSQGESGGARGPARSESPGSRGRRAAPPPLPPTPRCPRPPAAPDPPRPPAPRGPPRPPPILHPHPLPLPRRPRRRAESKAYHRKTKDMYFNALLRKYVPVAVIVAVVLLVLLVRWRFY